MCIALPGASRRGGPTPESRNCGGGTVNFSRNFHCDARIAGKVGRGGPLGLVMTRTAVGYVSLVAAAVSVAALGYAVLWAYVEPQAPPLTMSTQSPPPVINAPVRKETEASASVPAPAQMAETA